MDPNVFRKGDASSCLVVDKTWEDVIGKPDFMDELAERIVDMMDGAEDFGLLTTATTFLQFKKAVNQILLRPLQKDIETTENTNSQPPDTILVDAYWDEIPQTENKWRKFKEAVARAYDMKLQIGEHQPLSERDTYQTVKDNFNDTVVKPMLGINEDE